MATKRMVDKQDIGAADHFYYHITTHAIIDCVDDGHQGDAQSQHQEGRDVEESVLQFFEIYVVTVSISTP